MPKASGFPCLFRFCCLIFLRLSPLHTHSATGGSGRRNADNSVYLQQCQCLSAFGDAQATAAALGEGKSALTPTPVLGENYPESEAVPLALISPMSDALPPRWWQPLLDLAQPHRGQGWGGPRRPVFITGSNYGVDNLYAIARDRDPKREPWGTPHGILAQLLPQLGWGANVSVFSHACVSAQLGLMQAEQALRMGLADEALVLSFDFLSPFVTGGFHALKILNSQFPQPYRRRDSGSIALGDGAAWAILSREPSAHRIIAQASHNEMHHFTANDPSGSGFRKVLAPLQKAAQGRRLWIKGHGTGTLEAGQLESQTCAEAFGETVPLISWKGGIGHTLGSCALVELAIALAAHAAGKIPPTTLCGETQDEAFSPNADQPAALDSTRFDTTLLLCNAFGGAHAGMLIAHEG